MLWTGLFSPGEQTCLCYSRDFVADRAFAEYIADDRRLFGPAVELYRGCWLWSIGQGFTIELQVGGLRYNHHFRPACKTERCLL